MGKGGRGQREEQVKGRGGGGWGEKERNTGSYPEITEEEQDGSWKELALCMSWIIIIPTTQGKDVNILADALWEAGGG